jgi:Putative transmembrane protein (PGPGW)
MIDWLQEHRAILFWLTAASVVVFLATLLIVPAVIVRLPDDYFLHERRAARVSPWGARHPVGHAILRVMKNLAGWVLVLAGLLMLVLPGQGLLTLLMGVLLIDFPGKYRFQKWLVSRRAVRRPINWLRARAGRPPFRVEPASARGES